MGNVARLEISRALTVGNVARLEISRALTVGNVARLEISKTAPIRHFWNCIWGQNPCGNLNVFHLSFVVLMLFLTPHTPFPSIPLPSSTPLPFPYPPCHSLTLPYPPQPFLYPPTIALPSPTHPVRRSADVKLMLCPCRGDTAGVARCCGA